MSKKVILINNVLVGGYGYDEENLPHEMINFFRADKKEGDEEDRYYVYVTPYGTINSELKIQDLHAILFVRSAGNGLVEVLAKAEVDSTNQDHFFTQGVRIGNDKSDADRYKNIQQQDLKDRYHELVDAEKITYGSVSLKDIHKDNHKDNEVLVTMRVKSICLPKKTFYLTNKRANVAIRPDVFYTGGKQLANQSMKAYFYEGSQEFETLSDLLNQDTYWQDAGYTPTYTATIVHKDKHFFSVIRQQDNELVFSSVFYHYLSTYEDFRADFLRDILKLDAVSSNWVVEREKDYMDIRLIDDTRFIIIENKIKSGINGLKEEKDTKDFKKDAAGKYYSQLSDYYTIAKATKKDVHPFIFAPNYNQATNQDYIAQKFVDGEQYTIIPYERIYDFFEKHRAKYASRIEFYEDFTLALKKHIHPVDNEHRDVLLNRLAKRIQQHNGTM